MNRAMTPRMAACILLLVPAAAFAQAELHPNQLIGDLRFTNANPIIRAVIDQPAARLGVAAECRSENLDASTYGTATTFADGAFELTVDTVDAGLSYRVQAALVRDAPAMQYLTTLVTSDPVRPEPEPDVRRDITECASLLRLWFVDPDGDPATISNVDVRTLPPTWEQIIVQETYQARASGTNVSRLDMLAAPAGVPQIVRIRVQVGSDPYADLLEFEITETVTFRCDEVVDLTITIRSGDGGGDPLPRIVGNLDVLGEHEIHGSRDVPNQNVTTAIQARGVWGNTRHHVIERDPSSGSFALVNLLPSELTDPPTPYNLAASACFGSQTRTERFVQHLTNVSVPWTGTVDVGNAFVVDPGRVRADIRLAGPPASADPVLADLRLILDWNGDGLNDYHCTTASFVEAAGAWMDLTDDWQWLAEAYAGIDAAYDPASGEARGDSLLVVGGPVGTISPWKTFRMNLSLEDDATPENPPSWRHVNLWINREDASTDVVAPGSSSEVPFHFCFGEVYLGVVSSSVPFHSPSLRVIDGRFEGVDFEGRNVAYHARQTNASGTPLLESEAANIGLIVTLLPEGDWTVRVTVNAQNPGGGFSTTDLVSIPIHVGCRQVIDVSTEVQVAVEELPACTGPGLVHVTGRVHGRRAIARIAWSLDGGPWTDTCAPCGVEPTFAFDVNVPSANSSLTVRAWDDQGFSASVVAFTGLTGEPSARDLVPDVTPFLVSKSPSGLRMTWEPRLTDEFTIHEGTIASLHSGRTYDHASIATTCRLPGSQRDIAMPAGNAYFLVTESCKLGNGSFGRDSFGRERPGPVRGCP